MRFVLRFLVGLAITLWGTDSAPSACLAVGVGEIVAGAGHAVGGRAISIELDDWGLHLDRVPGPNLLAFSAAQPVEELMKAGTTRLLRTVRRWIRGFGRTIVWALQQWADWTVSALVVVLLGLLAPLLDRQLFAAWRRDGFGAFRMCALALAVYIRLLFDRRAPMIGKLLLLFAVLFGVAPNDLLQDRLTLLGFVDDILAIGLASRIFTRLCPDRLVEEHAIKAARAWERTMRARIPSRALTGTSQP